jgi:hypothetical protein
MRILKFCLLLPAAWLLCACEPSPREAAEIFCRELEAGNWGACGRLMTPELREDLKEESRGWPILLFAQSYYSDEIKCRLLKYETKNGRAHTLVNYSWRWNRVPMPGSVILDLVWRPTNGCWRVENVYATSHFDLLLPVTGETPPELRAQARLTGCGLRYQKPCRDSLGWRELGKTLEDYLATWYE